MDLLSNHSPTMEGFFSRLFQEVCNLFSAHRLFIKKYEPQNSGQLELYSRTIVTELRFFLAHHPRDWDLYTRYISNAYNCQQNKSTEITPLDLTLSNLTDPDVTEKTFHMETTAKVPSRL